LRGGGVLENSGGSNKGKYFKRGEGDIGVEWSIPLVSFYFLFGGILISDH